MKLQIVSDLEERGYQKKSNQGRRERLSVIRERWNAVLQALAEEDDDTQ